MIDGLSSTLPVSERLQRLRQYSLKFRNGIFDYEDIYTHADFIHQLRGLRWNSAYPTSGSSVHYSENLREYKSFISVFTDGSAQAGIQSRRWIMPIGTSGDQMRFVWDWLIDHVHDLRVTIERVKGDANSMCVSSSWHMAHLLIKLIGVYCLTALIHYTSSSFYEVRFCSWSGSQTARMDHPAAMLPCIQVFPSSRRGESIPISSTIMGGHHVIWQLVSSSGHVRNHSIHVCNWRTGQMVSVCIAWFSARVQVHWG